MNFFKGPYSIISLHIAAFILLFLSPYSHATENGNCRECHKKYIAVELDKTYIHKPFLEKKCKICHSPDWVKNAAESDGKAVLPKKTKKLGSDENLAQAHLFSIPRDYNLSILFLEAKSEFFAPYHVKLKVDPFETLESLSSDAKPPEIYDVQVIEVKKGALVSAKVRWHTDELSNSRIRYGTDHPDSHSLDSSQYLSDHSLELFPLKPDATYYFKVISEDIYGNTKESQVYSFATDKNFSLTESLHIAASSVPLKLQSYIFRSDDNYLVRISANQHVSIELSTYDLPSASPLLKNPEDLPPTHPPLKNIYETNVLICETCHLPLSEKFSHPVHFRARLGSNIPSDYPRLPNGQMSCLTCHDYHASNNAYHLRKSAERELCIGCHKRSFRNR